MTDIIKNNKRPTTKIFKKIFGFGVFLLLFLGINQQYTYAQAAAIDGPTQTTSQQTLEDSLQKTKAMLDIVLKSIHMLSRPLLVIAGNAMDNSLVYGSVFHLDLPLRKFWNIMKNFANYALGFVLLYHILKSLFTRKGAGNIKDEDSPLGIIKKILIAGILIQASRFMVSAVVDISTIATYSIGGMPLTILQNDPIIGKQKILGVSSTINIGNSSQNNILDDITTYWTYGDETLYKIANCRLGSGENGKYIIGKEINFVSSGSQFIKLQKDMCVLRGSIYRFHEFPELEPAQTNPNYKQILDAKISENINLTGFEECGFIIPIYSGYKYNGGTNCTKDPKPDQFLALADFGYAGGKTWLESITGTTINTLIDKSKGFVGPLITIYSSALNFSQLNQFQSSASSISFGIVLEFAIKAIIGVMLILPIGALAIIMVARIGILWMIIAFIPIIIIDHVLLKKNIAKSISVLETENIIKIIFAPVLVVFGLSISLIFMSTLTQTLKQYQPDPTNLNPKSGNEQMMDGLGIKKDSSSAAEKEECYMILGMRRICTNLQIGGGLDNISYFLINIFGIAIMWSLLFWTISMTGNIGKKVGEWTKNIGENFAGNIPIVPIPGGGLVGAKHVFGKEGLINKGTSYIENKMNKENTDKIADFMGKGKDKDPEDNTSAGNPQINAEQIGKITNEIKQSTTEINENKLKQLIGDETTKKLDGKGISITQRIQEPENIKLIYQEFEKQGLITDKTSITNNFNKLGINLQSLENLKTVIDYKAKFDQRKIPISTMVDNLNSKLLEALVIIPLDTEISLTELGVNKKYKITKNTTGTYQSTEIPTPSPTPSA